MLSTVKGTNNDGTLISQNELGRAKVAGGVGDDRWLRGGVSNATVEAGGEEIETRTPRISSGSRSLDSGERPMVKNVYGFGIEGVMHPSCTVFCILYVGRLKTNKLSSNAEPTRF
jgi:hypothetical protein